MHINCMQLWSARVLPLFITRSYISYIVSYHWAIACCVVLHDHLVYFHTAKTDKQTNKQQQQQQQKTLVAARHQCIKYHPPGRDITITYPLSQDIVSNILFIMCIVRSLVSCQVSHYKKLFVCCHWVSHWVSQCVSTEARCKTLPTWFNFYIMIYCYDETAFVLKMILCYSSLISVWCQVKHVCSYVQKGI